MYKDLYMDFKLFYFSTRRSLFLAQYPVSGKAKQPTRHVARHLSSLNIMLRLDLLVKPSAFIFLVLDPPQAGLNLSNEKSLLSKIFTIEHPIITVHLANATQLVRQK